MVDWDRVEELRAKGWDWDRIADDPKVSYKAPPGISDKGRALRSLYIRHARSASREAKAEAPKAGPRTEQKPKWTLARAGMLATPLFAIWFLIAYFVPSPVGIFLSAIPFLAILLAISAAVLAFGLLRSEKKWSSTLRSAVTAGIILGLVVSAVFGIAGLLGGYPTLTPFTSPEPNSFQKAANPLWSEGGKPVYFFFGSAACPYCSASSWAMEVALQRFGSLTGTTFDTSSPTDVDPNTPEVVLAGASFTSSYITLQVAESTYNQAIQLPAFGNVYQNAYFVAYDSGGSIPFVVIGGQYFTVGTLVDPGNLAGMTPQEVQGEVSTQSGAAWSAISPGANWLTAYILKVDGGVPSSLLTGAVLSDYDQIS